MNLFALLPLRAPLRESPATCDYCRFAATTAGPSGRVLECRRNAPGSYPNVHFPHTGTRFPWVAPDESCGEFRRLG